MKENNFKIITTVYNAEKYVGKCIDSVLSQTYKNWEWRIIDDCSTDSTFSIIKEKLSSLENVTIIRHEKNNKALKTYFEDMPLLCNSDDDVVISIDGDDWLYSDDVLEYINQQYQDNTMLTYGQYKTSIDIEKGVNRPGCSKPLEEIQDVRKFGVNFSHLKTWKYKLWKNIKEEDLKREDGKFIQKGWDIPMMSPMVEMAGLDRIKYIDKVLYVYNIHNPINEFKIDSAEQEMEDRYIRSKKPYERLDD